MVKVNIEFMINRGLGHISIQDKVEVDLPVVPRVGDMIYDLGGIVRYTVTGVLFSLDGDIYIHSER